MRRITWTVMWKPFVMDWSWLELTNNECQPSLQQNDTRWQIVPDFAHKHSAAQAFTYLNAQQSQRSYGRGYCAKTQHQLAAATFAVAASSCQLVEQLSTASLVQFYFYAYVNYVLR